MALTFRAARAVYDGVADVVRFMAMDGAVLVKCAVTRQALMDRAHTRRGTGEDLLALYEGCADEVQSIAQEKYAAKQFEADGIILVKTRDLNH